MSFEYLPIRDGQDGDDEGQWEERAEADDDAHRHPESGVGDDHRDHAECGGGGGQEDGAHTSSAGFEGGVLGSPALLFAQRLRVLEHDDGVAHDDAYQADDTQHGGDAEVQAEEPQPEARAKHTDERGGER